MAALQYKYYALFLLTVVGVFNYLDRFVLPFAIEPIKAEFQLSDGQLGLMSGFAFALFYAVAGIPIARWADRGNRNHVITVTAALWSALVAVMGLVGSFSQLLLVRVGIAVGESGCVPPAQSLISDYFDRTERPRAMSIYFLASPIAMIIAYSAGSWAIDQWGWRITFMMIGLPGVLLAIMVKFTLREPRLKQLSLATEVTPPLKDVLSTLARGRSFRHIVCVFCLSMFFAQSIAVWSPAFYTRSYHVSAGEVGAWLALTWGVGGMFTTLLGGYLATRYAAGREELQMKSLAIVIGLSMIVHVFCYISSSKTVSLIMVSIVMGGILPLSSAPIFSAIQSLVEERMRALALALIYLFGNLIGFGLGPVIVGVVSDALAASFGQESLRYALLVVNSPCYLWAAFHAWKAGSTIESDIRVVEKKSKSAQFEGAASEPAVPSYPPDSFPTVS